MVVQDTQDSRVQTPLKMAKIQYSAHSLLKAVVQVVLMVQAVYQEVQVAAQVEILAAQLRAQAINQVNQEIQEHTVSEIQAVLMVVILVLQQAAAAVALVALVMLVMRQTKVQHQAQQVKVVMVEYTRFQVLQ
jgi:hypothetical protein